MKNLTTTEVRNHASSRFHVDPTPEEIRERCAEIQAEWDHETTMHRLGYRMQQSSAHGDFGKAHGLRRVNVRGVSPADRKGFGDG